MHSTSNKAPRSLSLPSFTADMCGCDSPDRLPMQFAEISRVLRPGGVLVASTFLKVAAPLGAVLGDDVVRPLNQVLNPPVAVNNLAVSRFVCSELCGEVLSP